MPCAVNTSPEVTHRFVSTKPAPVIHTSPSPPRASVFIFPSFRVSESTFVSLHIHSDIPWKLTSGTTVVPCMSRGGVGRARGCVPLNTVQRFSMSLIKTSYYQSDAEVFISNRAVFLFRCKVEDHRKVPTCRVRTFLVDFHFFRLVVNMFVFV